VRLLVDSHVALWWLDSHAALGGAAQERIGSAREVFYSAVTPWELGIKKAAGKVDYPDDLTPALDASGFLALPITVAHATLAPTLPPHHRDPFDRMLVAQAQLESLVLVSADRSLRPYEVDLLDAAR
jgi:PIN domain nuclease of toxin-antitoxin system